MYTNITLHWTLQILLYIGYLLTAEELLRPTDVKGVTETVGHGKLPVEML